MPSAGHDGVVLADGEALVGERDGGREILGERQTRVVSGEVDQTRGHAGDAGRQCAIQGALGCDLASGVEKHGGRGGGGRGFARVYHAVVFVLRVVHQEERTTADA